MQGIFLSAKRGLMKIRQRDIINFFLIEYLIATPYISFENLQAMYLCQLKMESQLYWFFFFNFETYSQIP